MTPYQRGNRDGLLNAAAEMDRRENEHEASAARYQPGVDRGRATACRCQELDYRAASIYREVAFRLRALAEALPEDPEAPTRCPKQDCDECGP